MHNEKNDQYYIERIKADLLFIAKHMENVDIPKVAIRLSVKEDFGENVKPVRHDFL